MTRSVRRTPVQERAVNRRERILQATAQLLSELDYAAINVAAIAERAETSIGSIYQFYPNKDAILHALAADYLADMRESNADVFNNVSLSIGQQAEQAVSWLFEYEANHPGFHHVLKSDWVSSEIKNAVAEMHAHMTAAIGTFIASVAPNLSRVTRHLAAELILATSKGVMGEMALHDPEQREAARQQLVRLITLYVEDLARQSAR
ncbi:MAG: TetR family transcriptional regulator [Chloroflexi bacterium]|nr:TetR family transcriptional regulator [Chloroflexota bacterium]